MPQGLAGFPALVALVRTTALKVLGKPGAEAGAALAGGTTSGAPTSGAFDVGDAVFGQDGSLWICTVAGSPGTFVQAGFANPLTTKADLLVGGASGAPNRLGVGSDTTVLTADSTQTLGVKWAAATGSGLYSAYVCLQDQKSQGTDGGTFTSGAWQTRDLNTIQADTGSNASLSSNQITLAAGTYDVEISAPAFYVNAHQTRLQNITDSSTLLIGTTEDAFATGANSYTVRSWTVGQITLATAKTLAVQHRCQTTKSSNGFGPNANLGTEVYTLVVLRKH